jgi:hypothetical protein
MLLDYCLNNVKNEHHTWKDQSLFFHAIGFQLLAIK